MPWVYDNQQRALVLNGPPHYNETEVRSKISKLRGARNRPGAMCDLLESILSEGKAPKNDLERFSKWCNWDDPSQETARAIAVHLFGVSPPRLIEPRPADADAQFSRWVSQVTAGVAHRPLPKRSDTPSPKDTFQQLVAMLPQFRQLILYGPPGTGKTRLAKRAAVAILHRDILGKEFPCPKCGHAIVFNEQNAGQEVRCPSPTCTGTVAMPILVGPGTTDDAVEKALANLQGTRQFDLVVFHPSYEYEQFVGGIAPAPATGGQGLQYAVKPGVFLDLCCEAPKHRSVVLIIDEINRGNLPKLLGELVYALEYRGSTVRLPFEYQWNGRAKATLEVPTNLYIIATMNSSDRSIGHIDAAVRRRFALMRVGPEKGVVMDSWTKAMEARCGEDLANLMVELNRDLANSELGEEIGVGHSYFLCDPDLKEPNGRADLREQIRRKWLYQVCPLLDEYKHLTPLEQAKIDHYNSRLEGILSSAPGVSAGEAELGPDELNTLDIEAGAEELRRDDVS